jgi:hypothetical protein
VLAIETRACGIWHALYHWATSPLWIIVILKSVSDFKINSLMGLKSIICDFFILFWFWWYWSLNSGPHACYAVLYYWNHALSPFCFGYFPDRVLGFCTRQTMYCFLCLLHNWDYRREPLCMAYWLRWNVA